MKLIHTADNHLGMPLTSLPLEKAVIRKEERLASFTKIIDYTISSKADMLLISGDLFDSPSPEKHIVSFCASEFKRLGNTPVFITLGNHDYSLDSSLFPGNVHLFPNTLTSFSNSQVSVTGISFHAPSESFSPLLTPPEDNSKINILCIHGDLFSQSEYNPLNKEFLSSLGYDYIALGHIHQSYISPPFCYPGCHDGSGFDESGIKGFVECDVDKTSARIRFIPSSSRVYETITIDISDFSSSEKIINEAKSLFEGGIYKVILTGSCKEGFSPNIDLIQSTLSKDAFFVKVKEDFFSDTDISQSTLFKLFQEYITENYNGDVADLALKYGTKALKGEDIYEI